MTPHLEKLSINKGFIHKIAVLGKGYYTLAGIDNLFIFAGSDRSWWQEPTDGTVISGERMHRVYGWIEGLQANAAEQIDNILAGVAVQIIEYESIPEADRKFLERFAQQPFMHGKTPFTAVPDAITIPDDIAKLLEFQINGLPRAMFPLKHRREGLPALTFDNEYDVQSLLHALLRPWIRDIRPEEYTPSYAGSSTRIDFLLPKYKIVLELKFVRDKGHGKKIGDELVLDISHYTAHPSCKQLWLTIYDPHGFIPNPGGIKSDLEKQHEGLSVRVLVLGTT